MALNLIMPMAGRGSRFAKAGITQPKPLVELNGRPFFWWAVESLRRAAEIQQMVFVALEEHERDFEISARVHAFYPAAKMLLIPEVTAGSAETAAIGLRAITGDAPVAINDCDHAFLVGDLAGTLQQLGTTAAAGLMTFTSSNPGFSYVKLDAGGVVTGTVEKQVASPFAIAGCYLFASAGKYLSHYDQYVETCSYDELFISGIYNDLLASGNSVALHVLQEHFPFGTPEEYRAVQERMQQRLGGWF